MQKLELPIFFKNSVEPPSFIFLLTWTFILGISYIIFGLIRPSISNIKQPLIKINKNEIKYNSLWWLRILHISLLFWPLFDIINRIFLYIFLPSKVLWRLQMLPISNELLGWCLNQLRLVFICNNNNNNNNNIEVCMNWELPINTNFSISNNFTNDKMNESEKTYFHYVVFASCFTMLCIIISIFSIFSYCSILLSRLLHTNRDKVYIKSTNIKDEDSYLSSCSENEEEYYNNNNNNNKEYISESDDISENFSWELGEADDACLNSPEALAAEKDWENIEKEKNIKNKLMEQQRQQQKQNKEKKNMKNIIEECWPVILSICYAGLYAFSGGLPILMRFIYPSCVLIVILYAMMY